MLDGSIVVVDPTVSPVAETHESASDQQTTSEPAKAGKAQIDEMIVELSGRWQGHDNASLELRHYSGLRLNALLGPPTKRQEYSGQVIERVAKAIHVSVSECSRMRWFSHHFPTVEGLKEKHPTLRNWSEARKLIAGMNTGRREKIHKPRSTFIRSLRTLTKKLREGPSSVLDKDQRENLKQAMRELRREVELKFGLSLGKPTGKPTVAKQSTKQSAQERKPNRSRKQQPKKLVASKKTAPAKTPWWRRKFWQPTVA